VPTVVAIEQNYDPATQTAQRLREELVYSHEAFRGATPRHELVRCFNERAVPEHLYAALSDSQVRFITGAGHGSYTSFTGHERVVLFDALQLQAESFRNRFVHLLSCQTGALLGLMCVQNGAIAFWGYSVDFGFPTGDDSVSRAFLQMDALIDRGILSGRNAGEIYEVITAYFWDVYQQLLDHRSFWASVLYDDFVHLVCPAISWGNATSRLGP
jgi:hypothetical protein